MFFNGWFGKAHKLSNIAQRVKNAIDGDKNDESIDVRRTEILNWLELVSSAYIQQFRDSKGKNKKAWRNHQAIEYAIIQIESMSRNDLAKLCTQADQYVLSVPVKKRNKIQPIDILSIVL